ncbi:class I tRNA ligase family protein [Pantoea agglomerans]|uniref:class I tRNA ligase family protein n=1 Tax=Enterobacter agglomerans TaxID=549 RepID=UPI0016541CED|nr:class I tRNA ligase family protein [Pantoea agglomerans]
MHSFKKLNRNELNFENNLFAQRLLPWPELNAPFEGSWCVIKPGAESTPHLHHEHEIFIAVKGSAFIRCEGEDTIFETGDIVQFNPHTKHSVINNSEMDFEMYSVWWDKNMSGNFLRSDSQSDGDSFCGKRLIIAPPPTPNGDLHVGHMAGPYLAGDIHARYQRLKGRPVNYATGTDDSQTYVVTSALKAGLSPQELCHKSALEIKRTLESWGVQLEGYAPFDNGYKQAVLQFLKPLYEKQKIRLKSVKLPWSELRSEFMVESYVTGECPICLAQSRGGLCESCGHPNNFDQLKNPMSTMPPYENLVYRDVEIMVFPVEEYREPLLNYYAEKKGVWRPHITQLMDELLSKELIDFPVTYPVSWGIPSPFPGTEGQVLNAWVEGMPASMYCNACGASQEQAFDYEWLSTTGNKLAYFLGFDNSYFWGVAHLSLLMAYEGKYILPDYIVPNEFYELENAKFSTSRGHLVWAHDLVKEIPRDYARFYLCLTSPETSRSNFSRKAMEQILTERLIDPWNALVNAYKAHIWHPADLITRTDVGSAAKTMRDRLYDCCELKNFSQSRLADWILNHIARLEKVMSAGKGQDLYSINSQLMVLLEGLSLVMIDLVHDISEKVNGDNHSLLPLKEMTELSSQGRTENYVP